MKTNYLLYDRTTGEIAQSGNIPEDHIELQNSDSHAALKCNGETHSTHYVDLSGETPAIVQMPECPGPYHRFDYTTHAWRADADLAALSERAKRDALLAESDWTQLPDVPLETKSAWADYRQALRDITDQPGFPFSVVWPTAPNKQ